MFIDTHFHLGNIRSFYSPDISVKSCMNILDKLDISYCINSHHIALMCYDIEMGMKESVRAYNDSDGRILSYYIYDPNIGKQSIEIMEKYSDRKIFKGIKIHPSFHGIAADDERYDAIWRYAGDKNIPIMSHTWGLSKTNPVQKLSYPPLFEGYIKKYPQVKFIFAHCGGLYDGINECVKLLKKYRNTYMDTAGDIYYNGLIEFIVNEVGSERILFGTDCIWMDPRTQLGMILGADIFLRDKENILFRNAQEVFCIVP